MNLIKLIEQQILKVRNAHRSHRLAFCC